MVPQLLLVALLFASAGDDASDRAKQAYAQRRYDEAARLFDQLWDERAEPRFLYNAAAAHSAAGHDLAALQRYLKYIHLLEVDASDRSDARAHLAPLTSQLSEVELVIKPAALRAHGRVEVTSASGETLDFDVAWLDTLGPEGSRLYLPAGAWSLRLVLDDRADVYAIEPASVELDVKASDPRRELVFAGARPPATLVITLGPELALARPVEISVEDRLVIEPPVRISTQEREVRLEVPSGPWRYAITPRIRGGAALVGELDLEPGAENSLEAVELRGSSTRDGDDRRTRLTLGASLGAVSLALVGTGATLVGVGDAAIDRARITDGAGTARGYSWTAEEERGGLMLLPVVGSMLAGGGLGAGVVSISAATGTSRRGYIAEASAGAALALVGGIAFGVEYQRYDSQTWGTSNPPNVPPAAIPAALIDDHRLILPLTAGLLGAGVGMAAGSVIGLLGTRPRGRRSRRLTTAQTNAAVSPLGASFGVSGAF